MDRMRQEIQKFSLKPLYLSAANNPFLASTCQQLSALSAFLKNKRIEDILNNSKISHVKKKEVKEREASKQVDSLLWLRSAGAGGSL